MNKFLLLSVIFFGFILRFYLLGDVPHGFHRDEAFFGYNAYSILKTGNEMTGDYLPLHLSSYLYSPAGYSYLSIIFIYIFGLGEFSVRFVSALSGSLSVPLIYFLSIKLFQKSKQKEYIGLVASVLFAISPWHINLSRTATENTVVVFFLLAGLICFFHWREKKSLFYLLGTFLLFFTTFFLYQAPRVLLPIFVPLLFISFINKDLLKQHIFILGLYILTVIVPLAFILNSSELSLRISSLSIATADEAKLVLIEDIHRDGQENVYPFITRMLHNKILYVTDIFLENYFSHLNYSFLFSDAGFPDRYRIPHMGLLFISTLPALLFGMYLVIRSDRKLASFLIGWIIISPIGSALAFDDVPNLQRTLFMLPPLIFLSAFGIVNFYRLIHKKRMIATVSLFIFLFSTILLLGRYMHQYYTHGSAYRPWYRNDGYRELVMSVNKHISKYDHAVITNRESAPTIFFLFYSKYDPSSFQDQTKNTMMFDYDRINFGEYIFSEEECPAREVIKENIATKTFEKDVLYVNSGLCDEYESLNIVDTIKRRDGSDAFYIVEAKQ